MSFREPRFAELWRWFLIPLIVLTVVDYLTCRFGPAVAPNTIGSASAEEPPTASKANLSKACCGHSHCTYDGLASEAAHARASIPSRAPAIVANGGSGRADALTYDTMPLPLWVDTVEKVFWGWRTKFCRAADALRAQRREGPHCFSEKRPRSLVSALQSIAVAESSKNQVWRDFWRRSIFDFFNSIGHHRTSTRAIVRSTLPPRTEVVCIPGDSERCQ